MCQKATLFNFTRIHKDMKVLLVRKKYRKSYSKELNNLEMKFAKLQKKMNSLKNKLQQKFEWKTYEDDKIKSQKDEIA